MSSATDALALEFERFIQLCAAGESRKDVFLADFRELSAEEKAGFLTHEARRVRNHLTSKRDALKADLDYQTWLKSKRRCSDITSAQMALRLADQRIRELNGFIQRCIQNETEGEPLECIGDNVIALFDHPITKLRAPARAR